jgi:hypothetical protein
MPNIPNRFEFEPDRNALNLWLFTRKGERHYGMSDSPGFYTTVDFGKDQFWFVLAMFLELVGVALLIANGLSLGDTTFATIAVIGAIALFAVDLFLAYKLHRKHGKKCWARNRLKVTDDNQEMERIKESLKKGKGINFLIVFSMILIALLKLGGIIIMGLLDHMAINVALAIMFGIIVYVHVYHTGYFLYEMLTDRAFKKQFKKYNSVTSSSSGSDRPYEAKTRRDTFYSNDKLLGFDKDGNPRNELSAHVHKIFKVPNMDKEGKAAYNLETIGILIDDDIALFLGQGGLDNEHKTTIARMCLERQLNIHTGNI